MTETGSGHWNPLIDLLEQDKPIFSIWANYFGVGTDFETATTLAANPNYDFILYDLEHHPYDPEHLRRFLWDLIDPGAVASQGRKAVKPVIARIPPEGSEHNRWVAKQVLDTGVAGLMFPGIETPEQAIEAVAAARYPQVPGSKDFLPEGLRGFSPATPARYWGMSLDEYVRKSDVWGLDPDGNLLLIFIIESPTGVENVHSIARALSDAGVKGILWAGGGDLAVAYGEPVYGGPMPKTQAGLAEVYDAGREFGLTVGVNEFFNFEDDFKNGGRAWFTVGPASLAGFPLTPEQREAVGR